MFEPNYASKMKSTDRVFVLEKIEGTATKDSKGMVDNRLFTGENKLHAKMDPTNCQWYMQYESGVVPEPLMGRFTSFDKLKTHVENYYHKRNIKIKQVIE